MKRLFNTLALTLISAAVFSQTTVTFTTSSTFLVPAGVTSVDIEVVGAGGSGGGNGGGGGGGGGYSKGTFAVTPGQTLTVTVGTPGSGASGGSTHVNNMITAFGGENGTVVTSGSMLGGGGAGGTATGGSINRTGGNGGGGRWTYFGGGGGGAAGSVGNGSVGGDAIQWTGVCQTPGGSAGLSGGAPGGNGGKGAGFTDAGCNVTDPSGNGLNYGGGGGGGNGNGGGAGSGIGGYATITYNGCTVSTATTVAGATITATQAGATYQWINCSGNTPIAGQTGQSFTATQTGNYAVIVNNGSCADTSACVNVVVCNLSATTLLNNGTLSAVQTGTYQWINCTGNTPVAGQTSQNFTPAQTGNYAVIINDNGCIDTSGCVNVVVCNLTATVTVQQLMMHAVQSGTYQWIDCSDSSVIAGATSQDYQPLANGDFAVIITSGGCTDTSACITMAGMGVENNPLSVINVYPNPFKTNIQVQNTTGTETFELVNAVGQVIWSGRDIASKDFSALSKGVYTLRITRDTNVRQWKLVKE